MSSLKILVWQHREAIGEPDVEVKIPANMAKWVPRLMKFIPKKTREENWGQDVDFDALFADLEKLMKEASELGHSEIMSVKSKDDNVKITVEN